MKKLSIETCENGWIVQWKVTGDTILKDPYSKPKLVFTIWEDLRLYLETNMALEEK